MRSVVRVHLSPLIVVFENVGSYGGVAQLGEHLPCKQGVRSSILLISTNLFERRGWGRQKRETGGRSSAGRAPALQAGGQEFDSPRLHQNYAGP